MILQIGKRYLRRDGIMTGELEPCSSPDFPFVDLLNKEIYTPSGRYFTDQIKPYYKDLVVEVV